MTFREKKKTFNARPFSLSITANKQNIHALGGKGLAGKQAASSPLRLSGTVRPNTAENKDHRPIWWRRKSTARFALAVNGSLLTLHSSWLSGLCSRRAGNRLKGPEEPSCTWSPQIRRRNQKKENGENLQNLLGSPNRSVRATDLNPQPDVPAGVWAVRQSS